MPKAVKQPNGRWKVRVHDFIDENGKRHYKAFTADTKKEAELMALAYKHEDRTESILFSDALTLYIQDRESVIAPSTLKEYKRCAKNDFELINDIPINKLNQEHVQKLVNYHAKTKAPKTVKNIHGLVSAVLKMYRPNFVLNTTLPQKDVDNRYIPTDADVKTIMQYTKEHDQEMYKAILLAAFGPLRRSEICGLKSTDINGSVIHVKSAIVNSENGWTEKKTKTESGDRYIDMPGFVIDEIRHLKGPIVELKPNMISDRHIDIVKACKLQHFTFHALRHYCASKLHTMGIPDVYIMERGGWKNDAVLKQIYRHSLSDESVKINAQANKKFAETFGNI